MTVVVDFERPDHLDAESRDTISTRTRRLLTPQVSPPTLISELPMASKTLILTSNNVVLPDYDSPQPATIIVDTTTGKIADIQLGVHLGDDDQDVQQINAGDNFILPGLVECVANSIYLDLTNQRIT